MNRGKTNTKKKYMQDKSWQTNSNEAKNEYRKNGVNPQKGCRQAIAAFLLQDIKEANYGERD